VSINREATIRWKGYDPDDLKPQSNKRVWANCENCGNGRWVIMQQYRPLCLKCSNSGENNSNYGKKGKDSSNYGLKHSKETKKKMSEANKGKNNPMYGKLISEDHKKIISDVHKGKVISESTRKKIGLGHKGKIVSNETKILLSCIRQGIKLGEFNGFTDKSRPYVIPTNSCIQINDWFIGAQAHHITKSIVIFIPSELHKHLKHNLRTGYNMGEMNVLALQFINRCYDG